MKGDKQGGWRWVVAVSGVVAVVQLGLGILLQPHIKKRSKKDSNERLGGMGEHGEDTEGKSAPVASLRPHTHPYLICVCDQQQNLC